MAEGAAAQEGSPLSFQPQGTVRAQTGPAGQHLAPGLGSPEEFWGLGRGIGSHTTRCLCQLHGTLQKHPCAHLGRGTGWRNTWGTAPGWGTHHKFSKCQEQEGRNWGFSPKERWDGQPKGRAPGTWSLGRGEQTGGAGSVQLEHWEQLGCVAQGEHCSRG